MDKKKNLKEKLMEFFIEEPEKEFYVRELARILKKSPATISKYLKILRNENILLGKKRYNHLLFKANTENEKFKQTKINYNLNKLRGSGIVEFLLKEFNPEAIVLFGSFAKGENIKSSDIDLLVITPAKKELNLEKFESRLGHKIQLFILSNKEIIKLKEKNKELLNSFINGIVLEGFVEVFK
jgi:predicted nucleotidyltransferase